MNLLTLRRKAAHLELRAEVLHHVRAFFRSRGYLEVETPLRLPVPIPEAHIDPVESEGWVLQASPEICMKPMVAAGYRRIFQIARCFRRGERGRKHLPEMTMLEWYAAGESYADAMDTTEHLVRGVIEGLGLGDSLAYGGATIDLQAGWERLTVADAFRRYASGSADRALAQGRFDEWMGVDVEPRLGLERPVFLHDYPAACGSLARLKPGDPSVAERFELYIAGLELCNGFSELTDPIEQARRFEAENDARRRAGRPVHGLPKRFLESLAALPACAGNALGLDRLVMLLGGAGVIDDVVAYTPEDLL